MLDISINTLVINIIIDGYYFTHVFISILFLTLKLKS